MSKFDDPITTEPAQIAAQLITQGLPLAIAQQIAASALPANTAGQIAASALPANTAGQILATGVKVIDVPVTLFPLAPLNSGNNIANGASTVVAPMDTTTAQSLEILVQFASSPGVGVGSWEFLVEWDIGGGVYGLREMVALYPDSDDHNATIIVPCRGAHAKITATNSTGFAAKLNLQVVSSQRIVDRVLVRQLIASAWGWSGIADESMLLVTNLVGNAGTNLPIPIRSGPARIVLAPDAPVTTLGRFILLSHNGVWMTTTEVMPVNATRTLSIIEIDANMPLAPVYLQWLNTPVGPANISIAVSWES